MQDAINPDKPNGGSKQDGFGGHGYAQNISEAAALGLTSGCDMNCGSVYLQGIPTALNKGMLTESDLDTALIRAFSIR